MLRSLINSIIGTVRITVIIPSPSTKVECLTCERQRFDLSHISQLTPLSTNCDFITILPFSQGNFQAVDLVLVSPCGRCRSPIFPGLGASLISIRDISYYSLCIPCSICIDTFCNVVLRHRCRFCREILAICSCSSGFSGDISASPS
jgi:hypothetical protein